MGMQLPAGWYGDPADTGRYRWWDGDQWTTHTQDKADVDRAAAAEAADPASRPLPDFDALPPEAEPVVDPDGAPRRPARHTILLVALLAVLAGAGVVTFGGGEPRGHWLTGEVRVPIGGARRGEGFVGDGAPCGRAGRSGIGAGTPVRVTNGRGEELGSVELPEGRVDATLSSASCVFPYQVEALPDAATYVVRVGRHPGRRASRDALEDSGWRLDIRLG